MRDVFCLSNGRPTSNCPVPGNHKVFYMGKIYPGFLQNSTPWTGPYPEAVWYWVRSFIWQLGRFESFVDTEIGPYSPIQFCKLERTCPCKQSSSSTSNLIHYLGSFYTAVTTWSMLERVPPLSQCPNFLQRRQTIQLHTAPTSVYVI